jgi:hypothetical protein
LLFFPIRVIFPIGWLEQALSAHGDAERKS